ncbi:hypothetical protein KKD61_05440 [Patescibacteria group bacterium]|nr:hypothetical protein [Patescibacteria group bacterium]
MKKLKEKREIVVGFKRKKPIPRRHRPPLFFPGALSCLLPSSTCLFSYYQDRYSHFYYRRELASRDQ